MKLCRAPSLGILLSTTIFICLAYSAYAQFSSATYDEAKSKDVYLRLYDSMSVTPDECLAAHYPDWTDFKKISAPGPIRYASTFCHIIVCETERKIQISFRGAPNNSYYTTHRGYTYSEKGDDIFSNLGDREHWEPSKQWGKSSPDHCEAWKFLTDAGILNVFNELWCQYCDFDVIVAGQGYGSCLAQFALITLHQTGLWNSDQMSFYSFGSPRCGDVDLMVLTHEAANEKYRIYTSGDLTPRLPKNNDTSACPAQATYTTVPSNKDCYRHCCYPIRIPTKFTNCVGLNCATLRCAYEEDPKCEPGWSDNWGWQFYEKEWFRFGRDSCP